MHLKIRFKNEEIPTNFRKGIPNIKHLKRKYL